MFLTASIVRLVRGAAHRALPWSLAAVLRTAALPSIAFACGAMAADRGDRAGDDADTVAAAALQAELQPLAQVLRDALQSPDLRVRMLVGSQLRPTDELSLPSTTLIPVDDLAELARGSTDPIVLSQLVLLCDTGGFTPKPTCDAVDAARRWTVAETQNQVAWLTYATTLHRHGDTDGARVAFERGSRASTWHDLFDDGPRIALALLPRSLGPRARLAALQTAFAISAARLTSATAIASLTRHCRDAALRDACLRYLDTIDRADGSMLASQAAVSLSKRMGRDPLVWDARAVRLDALRFGATLDAWRDWTEIDDPDDARATSAMLERRIAAGEMRWARERLVDSGLGETVAATRYRASLKTLQEAARTRDADEITNAVDRGERGPR